MDIENTCNLKKDVKKEKKILKCSNCIMKRKSIEGENTRWIEIVILSFHIKQLFLIG